MRARTAVPLTLPFWPATAVLGRVVHIPAGAELERVGERWVLARPTQYAQGDLILKHDLAHHYLPVPDSSVEEVRS